MQKNDWESKKINKRKKKDFTFQFYHNTLRMSLYSIFSLLN